MMMTCIIVIGDFSSASRGSLCTMSFPPYRSHPAVLLRPAKRERSTFHIHAPMATILKVSRGSFKGGCEYGIFSASIRTAAKTR
jgi:hypothetical protein